ncbi:MAG: GNAT family N-acetyltransferase [Pseudomonadota bacterium]
MITTERLLIRPAQDRDAADLFEVYGDAKTMRYWDTLPDAQLAQTEQRVRSFMQAEHPGYFVITLEGRAIGTAGIHSNDEIGFILNRAHWRKGLMRECLQALIPWCFETLNLPQITADTDPRNTASITLLKTLGFEETGRASRTLKVGDTWCDSVYFRIARSSLQRGDYVAG